MVNQNPWNHLPSSYNKISTRWNTCLGQNNYLLCIFLLSLQMTHNSMSWYRKLKWPSSMAFIPNEFTKEVVDPTLSKILQVYVKHSLYSKVKKFKIIDLHEATVKREKSEGNRERERRRKGREREGNFTMTRF